nr:transposase [Candidatus Enterovibrio luxaltus]
MFWIDEVVTQLWNQTKQGNYGIPPLFSDLAMMTALMVKRVFLILLRGLQGFISFVFNLLNYRCHALTIHALQTNQNG